MARHFIKKFQTISRHEAQLRQPPAVIECLVAVLSYIKTVLNDDGTQELFSIIKVHLDKKGKDAHYLNLDLLSNQILDALQNAFISIGIYANDRILMDQFHSFFEDVYDGSIGPVGVRVLQLQTEYDLNSVIPKGYNDFVKWLVSNPEIYVNEIPDDYDAFRIGLTLRLAKEWFKYNHDDQLDAHAGTISEKINKLMTACSVLTAYRLNSVNFDTSVYKIIGSYDYQVVMDLVNQRLIQMGNPQTIDYTTYEDSAELPLQVGYDETVSLMEIFFASIYDDTETAQVQIFQFNIESMLIMSRTGVEPFVGYATLLSDFGETDGKLFDKKYSDYYLNHLQYVLSSSMTPEYQAVLTDLRSSVNTNYTKMYHVHTILHKYNFGVELGVSISHIAQERTLDLLNITGLSKSVVCVSLIPYRDINNNLFNKVVIAFDNYNPAFTAVLLDGITEDSIEHMNIVISVSRETLSVHTSIDDQYDVVRFPNIGRMFNVDPFFMYVIPRVAEYERGTTRITGIKLYGKTLSDSDAMSLIAGFRHQ